MAMRNSTFVQPHMGASYASSHNNIARLKNVKGMFIYSRLLCIVHMFIHACMYILYTADTMR